MYIPRRLPFLGGSRDAAIVSALSSRPDRTPPRRRAAAALLGVPLLVGLSACGQAPAGLEGTDFSLATRVASPQAESFAGTASSPAADVRAISALVPGSAGSHTVLMRSAGGLLVASLEEAAAGAARAVRGLDAAAECGTPSASVHAADTFVVACPRGEDTTAIFLIDGTTAEATHIVDAPLRGTAAVQTAGGRIVVASATDGTVLAYTAAGEESGRTTVDRPTNTLVAVGARTYTDGADAEHTSGEADGDAIVAINADDTVIQGVKVDLGRPGAALRIGTGVGQAVPGGDNMVLATNVPGNQLFVYTVEPVIRLHQVGNTGTGPWAVAWDAARNLAWVSTTGDNTLTAYRLSGGVPEAVGSVDAPANVTSLAVVDGSLLVATDGADSAPALVVVDAAAATAAVSDPGRTDFAPRRGQ
ncbi:hypothetical protein C1Y63_03115 [Corynebacterium sp. 13CS0277]|uniref:hypothetical protein n=1 Tax=Corynebacterium sp. 13CS0277 TaxID=2071994 RepID=UPI000D02707B|nr:hypothetical protein [Corynebacterium sp. 13CS0277]PRQ12072.1 hypothetical protein C1Y63_03115 [Corynebacterium sp. 13CS0277]